VPEFKVIVHKRVFKFLKNLKDEAEKKRLKEAIFKLENYPLTLRRLDVKKLEGLERTFRIRIGDFKIIFHVDKREKVIYVTHIGLRESIYKKI